mgnify:CR=1 FL=1
MPSIDFWLIFGLAGQFVFFARMVLQWVHSERQGKSIITFHFWTISMIGTVMILIYSIHRNDPVFIVGQIIALFIYWRNIVLMRRQKDNIG